MICDLYIDNSDIDNLATHLLPASFSGQITSGMIIKDENGIQKYLVGGRYLQEGTF